MEVQPRRLEWQVDGTVMGYSRPVTAMEHRAFVQRLKAHGDLEVIEPLSVKTGTTPNRGEPIIMTPAGAEYYLASLVLDGLPSREIETKMREISIRN